MFSFFIVGSDNSSSCSYVSLGAIGKSRLRSSGSKSQKSFSASVGKQQVTVIDYCNGVIDYSKIMMYKDDRKAKDSTVHKANPSRSFRSQRNFVSGKEKGKAFYDNRKPYTPPTALDP
ncbi:hypothetical protein Lal_00026734 [Lupinus albus]|nr:hypothetical protein Lal_00026734 [Lupinus albus]